MARMTAHDKQTLERLQRLTVQGRLAEAELELNGWCRQDDCPAAARAMLAALLARREDFDGARAVLGDPQRRDPEALDATEAKVAVSVLIACELDDSARRLAAWLYHRHGDDPQVANWIAVMDVPGLTALPATPDAVIERFAAELSARVDVVPSLVVAQKYAPRTRPIALLRAAIARVTRDQHTDRTQSMLCQALSELGLLIGDEDDARRWAHRGLRLDPFNATMALVLSKIEDDESVGPKASEMLKRVSLKFPGYPDVAAALAQRLELDQQRDRSRVA